MNKFYLFSDVLELTETRTEKASYYFVLFAKNKHRNNPYRTLIWAWILSSLRNNTNVDLIRNSCVRILARSEKFSFLLVVAHFSGDFCIRANTVKGTFLAWFEFGYKIATELFLWFNFYKEKSSIAFVWSMVFVLI